MPKSRHYKKKKGPGFWIFVIFLLVVFLGVTNYRLYKESRQLRGQVDFLEGEVKKMQGKNSVLKTQAKDILDSNYQEQVLRERNMYKKKGEEIIAFAPDVLQKIKSINATNTTSTWQGKIGEFGAQAWTSISNFFNMLKEKINELW